MNKESNLGKIKILTNEVETLKEEKDVVDGKLARLLKSSKDLENIIESQRSEKVKEGVGYNAVPPSVTDLYLSPKKDLSWTGKFEQWQFRIQQYLQHEHYALWEVIEFGDSYKVPTNTDPDDTTTKRDADQYGRTITFTTEDMQKKKNNVKARTTLLLSLPDEHQLSNEDGNTICVTTASTAFPTGSVNVATISQDTASAYIASQSNGSQIKFEDINQIDEDDIEEMDIKWNMALLSMRADKF
nr:hypothetical protein [Tanacetum cinerariifolium]